MNTSLSIWNDLFSGLNPAQCRYVTLAGTRTSLQLQVPGYGKDDLELILNNNELELRAKGKLLTIIQSDLRLNAEDISATVEHGVMTLELAKAPDGPVKIQIK